MEDRVKAWVEDNPRDSGNASDYGYGGGSGFGTDHGRSHGDGAGSGYGTSDGAGYGDCYGNCPGSYSGDGSGYGVGSGDGDGAGSGDCYGSSFGYAIASFNGNSVFYIDGVPTIISSVKGDVAIGAILQSDFTETKCFIAKGCGRFAHGTTLREAVDALREKILSSMCTDEAIVEFAKHFAKDQKYAGREFFKWHHYLTGSCLAGREAFVRDHKIDLDEKISVKEFIALCENDYGGKIISRLKECYM